MNNANYTSILSEFFSTVLHEDADSEEYLAELTIMYLLNKQAPDRIAIGNAIRYLGESTERQRLEMFEATGFAWEIDNPEGFFSDLTILVESVAEADR